jgi:CRP-like cAMP-binding protein
MAIDINFKILKNISFLAENFSEELLIVLSKKMTEHTYGPEEVIFSHNDLSEFFYILNEGEIQFYIDSSKKLREKSPKILETFNVPDFSFFNLVKLHSFWTT